MITIEPGSSDISGFVRRIRSYWWGVFAFVVAGVACAAVVTSQQPRVYESTASVLVERVGADLDRVGTGSNEPNLGTEAQLVRSTTVAAVAADLLHTSARPESLASHVTVTVPAGTAILMIRYSAGSPIAARAGSDAFARAYLSKRKETAAAELASLLTAVNGRLGQLNTQLAQQNTQLTATPSTQSAVKANLESQRTATINQISTLATEANQLAITPVNPGQIIQPASLPGRPAEPGVPGNLGLGAAAGLLAGAAAMALRQQLARRVQRPADLPRRTNLHVLATLPRRLLRLDLVAPFEAGGPVFDRLRNEVLANLPATGRPGGQVVVVTGADRGSVATLFAANLAAALARTGSETLLVSTRLPQGRVGAPAPVPLVSRLFGVRPGPGLSEVITRRVDLADVAQPTAASARLRVITMGRATPISPDGSGQWLQSRAMRDVIGVLRQQAAYVVIEAPSTSVSADAQSLASAADAAIVAVELRRTRYSEVADAAAQLRRVGTTVLGAVVVPRAARGSTPEIGGEAAPAKAPVIGRPRRSQSSATSGNNTGHDLQRPPTEGGLRRPSPNGQRPSGRTGVRMPAENGLRPPTEPGLRVPTGRGLRAPTDHGVRPPEHYGFRNPGDGGRLAIEDGRQHMNGNGRPTNGNGRPANGTNGFGSGGNDASTAVLRRVELPEVPDQRVARPNGAPTSTVNDPAIVRPVEQINDAEQERSPRDRFRVAGTPPNGAPLNSAPTNGSTANGAAANGAAIGAQAHGAETRSAVNGSTVNGSTVNGSAVNEDATHSTASNSAAPNSTVPNGVRPAGPVRRYPPANPAQRDANAMLAALTEDGPLDGVR